MGYKFPTTSFGASAAPTGSYQLPNLYSAHGGSQYSSYNSGANGGRGAGNYGNNAYAAPAYSPLSISSPVTEYCASCRKAHVPDPERMVTDPRTKKKISTCSAHCQKELLRSMVKEVELPQVQPRSNYASMPVVRPASHSLPPVGAAHHHLLHNTAAPMSTGYSGTQPGNPQVPQWTSAPPASFAPTNTSYAAPVAAPIAPMPASQYVQPAPHYAQAQPTYNSSPLVYGQPASHAQFSGPKSTPQYGNQPSSSHGPHGKPHAAPARRERHGASSDKRPGTLASSSAPAAGNVSVNSLELQLQKWLDQRQKLPPLWGVRTVILDTNVLLDLGSPDILLDLRRLSSDLLFIVPYVLVQELDSLKARAAGPNYAARQAITRLHELLFEPPKKDAKPWIRGQKATERLALEGTLQTTSGDDRILECLNYFHTYSTGSKKAMLLTHDKNLQLKARILGITTGGVAQLKEFFSGFQWLQSERTILQTQLSSARVTSNTAALNIPDWELENYQPEKVQEEDEFEKAKREADAAAAKARELKAKSERSAEEASKNAAQHADALSRLPAGTRIDLYDDSSVESPVHSPRSVSSNGHSRHSEPTSKASSRVTSHASTPNHGLSPRRMDSDSEGHRKPDSKKKHKKRKDKSKEKKKNSKKRERDHEAPSNVADEEAPSAKKPVPEVIFID